MNPLGAEMFHADR